MTRRYRCPQPSFATRRIVCDGVGSARLVRDERVPCHERPLAADPRQLERFSALMAAQGWPAHVSRLAYDRLYARERFSFARRIGVGELPALARELLECWRATRVARA